MSHLAALLRTPFDLSVFPIVARQRLRRTLALLTLLVLVATAVTTTAWTLELRQLVRRLEPHLDELPTIVIERGQARADVEQPWSRTLGRDDAGHEVVVIIDTTGRRTDFGPRELGVFLQRTRVLVKSDEDQLRAFSLERVPDLTIGPEIARAFIRHWMRRVPLYLAIALMAWYGFVKIMQALLLVLPALLGSSRRPLGFGALFSIGVYALVPSLWLAAVRPLLPFSIPLPFALSIALAVVYAVLGGQRAAATPPSGDATP
jgi:hypothetical protein